MFFKMQNNVVATDIYPHLLPKNDSPHLRTENTQAYHLPHSRTNYYNMSFFPRTARDWNILPESTVSSPSVQIFKRLCDDRENIPSHSD